MITDDDIDEVVKLFIEVANGTDILKNVMDDYKNRSLGIRIYDSAYNTGFILQQGRIRAIRKLDMPTCIVTLDKATFWKVLNIDDPDLQRIAIYTAYYTERTLSLNSQDGDVQIHAENLIKIFTKISEMAA
ncbi:MAG: hypothetical protein GWP10_10050 [Nitrospiraceae bacterium]|nr:hypothetical protein [Nitrospiraceae bacterium]